MKDFHHKKIEQGNLLREIWERAKQTGDIRSPRFHFRFRRAFSKLGKGSYAIGEQERLLGFLEKKELVQEIFDSTHPKIPKVESGYELYVGRAVESGTRVYVDRRLHPVLVPGKTGFGKTNFIAVIREQLLRETKTNIFDYKKESRRFPEALVLEVGQLFINILEPVGNKRQYWSGLFGEIGRYARLSPHTWPDLLEIMLRIDRGRKGDEPHPSLKDFEKTLRVVGKKERRPKLVTAAQALNAINAHLGKTAYVRQGPDIESKFPHIGYDFAGLKPDIYGLLSAVLTLRTQSQSSFEGHEGVGVKKYIFRDEGGFDYDRDLNQSSSYGMAFGRQETTLARSSEVAVYINIQSFASLEDSVIANHGMLVCFCLRDPKDARLAASLLNLDDSYIPTILNLLRGEAFVWANGFKRGIHVCIPKANLGEYISDTELNARQETIMAELEQQTIFTPITEKELAPLYYEDAIEVDSSSLPVSKTPEHPSSTPAEFVLNPDEILFLQTSQLNPATSLGQLYQLCRFPLAKGDRIKGQLVKHDYITLEIQRSSNGRPPKFVRLTTKATQILSEHGASQKRKDT